MKRKRSKTRALAEATGNVQEPAPIEIPTVEYVHVETPALPVQDPEIIGGKCDNCAAWMHSGNPSYLDGEYCARCVPLPV